MSSRDPFTFHFGPYRLNPAARELWLNGERQTLAPKALDALLWLFEHRDRAVGRDELAATVWGRADVTDKQLDQLIRQLRKAFGDSGSTQDYIRTVPRFGYRWVADVETEPVESTLPAGAIPASVVAEPTAEPTTESVSAVAEMALPAAPVEPSRRPSRGWVLLGLLAVALVVVTWFGRGLLTPAPESPSQSVTASAARTTPLVAILPVTIDAHADTRHAWLRLGLMDLMSARLMEGGVHVVPAHNILALMAGEPEARTAERVRASTGATVVVTPSIEQADGGWRLHLELSGIARAVQRIEVFAPEPTQTAREAADRVLVLMGRSPVTTGRLETGSDDDETASRLTAAVTSERYDIARTLLDDLPETRRLSPRVRFMAAHVLLHEGRTEEALEAMEAVADAPPDAVVDDEVRASAQGGAAVILMRKGRSSEALTRLDQAVRIATAPRLTNSFAGALFNRAAVHARLGEWAAADADFAQARVAMEMVGDSLGLAELASNQAATLIDRQRFSEAGALLAQASERLERFPPGEFLLATYGNQIALKLALLEIPSALEVAALAQQTLERRMPEWPTDLRLLFHTVRADLAAGRFASAKTQLDTARATLAAAPSPEHSAMALQLQAQLAFDTGRGSAAKELAARASALYALPDLAVEKHGRERSLTALLLLKASLMEGQVADAADALSAFDAWARGRSDPTVAAHLALGRALVAARDGPTQRAVSLFATALETALPLAPATVAQVAIEYGRYLIRHDDLDGAARVVGRIAPWARTDYGCALAQVELYQALGQADAWRRSIKESRSLAGERAIPPELERDPGQQPPGRAIAKHPGDPPSS